MTGVTGDGRPGDGGGTRPSLLAQAAEMGILGAGLLLVLVGLSAGGDTYNIILWVGAPFVQIASGAALCWALHPRPGMLARRWLLSPAVLLGAAMPLVFRALALFGEPAYIGPMAEYDPGWGARWAYTAANIALPLVGAALLAGLAMLRRPRALALGVVTFTMALGGSEFVTAILRVKS